MANELNKKKGEMANKMTKLKVHDMSHPGRSYPMKGELTHLRKTRGDADTEKELASYKASKRLSQLSGTWGKKNSEKPK